MGKTNSNLHTAKVSKNDEFYTQYEDIANEIKYYKKHFEGKTVLCNCDDPLESNFTKYFILNFHQLKLKKLICTFYDINNTKLAFAFEYYGEDVNNDGIISEEDIRIIRESGASRTILVDDKGFNFEEKEKCWSKGIYGSGDFRSKNVIDYLKESDIVVTNPPFSLFREYVKQLMDYNKKFIIIGNINAVTYKEIFPLIKENKLWIGYSIHSGDRKFYVPNNYKLNAATCGIDDDGKRFINVKGVRWFTNIEHSKRYEPLDLYEEYNPINYPKYDNYDAIEVSKTSNIPCNYEGVIGVPITFLDKYCPNQFEIIDAREIALNEKQKNKSTYLIKDADSAINGKPTYARICIKKLS